MQCHRLHVPCVYPVNTRFDEFALGGVVDERHTPIFEMGLGGSPGNDLAHAELQDLAEGRRLRPLASWHGSTVRATLRSGERGRVRASA